MAEQKNEPVFRVRFLDRDDQKPVEVLVKSVGSSEFFGLVRLSGFLFEDNQKLVILPDEDAVRKRFGKTNVLHIPYHNLVFVEEFQSAPADLKNLPFLREAGSRGEQPESSDPKGAH